MISERPIRNHMTTIFTDPVMVLMALVFLFVSLLNHQLQLTVLILSVLGLIALARLWSMLAFSRMTFDLEMDKNRVFPGEHICFKIRAGNHKLLPVQIQVTLAIDETHLRLDSGHCENGFLLWFQKTLFVFNIKAVQRGCITMGHPGIVVGDLFNFFPRQQIRQDGVDILVYPKINAIRPFSMPEHFFFGVPGARSPVQDPVYILGTREYQSFTPVKRIHWKASARYHKLQEKVCEPSVQEKILIVVDVESFHAVQAVDDFEIMLEAAASMAVYFQNRGNAVGFMTNAVIKGRKPGVVPIGRNSQTLSMILETIARMEMRSGNSLMAFFQQHIRGLWGINCIFCSHTIDSSIVKIKQFYSQKKIPVKYFVSRTGDTEHGQDFISDTIHPIDTICI